MYRARRQLRRDSVAARSLQPTVSALAHLLSCDLRPADANSMTVPLQVPLTQATMTRHQRFLRAAAAEAEQSTLETKHGSLLVRSGKILGSGHNSDRSRLADMPGNPNMTSLHSEVSAISLQYSTWMWTFTPVLAVQVAAVRAVPWVLQGLR